MRLVGNSPGTVEPFEPFIAQTAGKGKWEVGAGLVPAQPRATTRVAPTGGGFMKQTSSLSPITSVLSQKFGRAWGGSSGRSRCFAGSGGTRARACARWASGRVGHAQSAAVVLAAA